MGDCVASSSLLCELAQVCLCSVVGSLGTNAQWDLSLNVAFNVPSGHVSVRVVHLRKAANLEYLSNVSNWI